MNSSMSFMKTRNSHQNSDVRNGKKLNRNIYHILITMELNHLKAARSGIDKVIYSVCRFIISTIHSHKYVHCSSGNVRKMTSMLRGKTTWHYVKSAVHCR